MASILIKRRASLLQQALCAAATGVFSAGLQATVVSATLYPSHAEVIWEEGYAVTGGANVIEIGELPVSLQSRDLQVQIQGEPEATITQVQVVRVEREDFVAGETRRLQNEIQVVNRRIQTNRDDSKAWQQQVTLMTHSAEQPGERAVSELTDMAAMLQETTQHALTQIRNISEQIVNHQAEKDRLEREIAQLRQHSKASKTVRLRIQSPEAGELMTRLAFQTTNANWRSEYNARLDTELEGRPGGEINLEHLAVVQQTTGIDWNGVTIRLSTANAMRGTAMPELSPWVVSTGNPAKYARSAMAAPEAMVASSLDQSALLERQSAFTEHYRIPRPVDIPSDRSAQRLTVAQHAIAVDLATWATPTLDPTGYLHATGVFDSDAPVPAGLVTLYRDSQSVGQARLPQLANGSTFSLGFGVDDGVAVRVVNELEHTAQEGVWKSENIQRRQNRFEITNHHQGAIHVRIFDRMPVSQQDNLTVKPLEITQPVEHEIDDKKGVMAWDRAVPPGKTLHLKSGFEVRVPEGKKLPKL